MLGFIRIAFYVPYALIRIAIRRKWWKHMPPFSWGRGYIKFGIMSLMLSIAYSICLYFAGFVNSPLIAAFLWFFFTGLTWILRPLFFKKARPCKDCHKVKA